jgi:hypothetical protein
MGHKVGHSPQSSAEVKNEYKCTFTPHTHTHAFTTCNGTNFLAAILTPKQAQSSQIPSTYYLSYDQNRISHIGRVRSLVVFLIPCRQMPRLPQLHHDSFPSNPIQFFIHQPIILQNAMYLLPCPSRKISH